MPMNLEEELRKIESQLQEVAQEVRRIANLYKWDRQREIERKRALKSRAAWEKEHLRASKRQ